MEKLSFSRLQAILQPDRVLAGVKSVATPPAQNTNLLQLDNDVDPSLFALASVLFARREEPSHILAVIELQLLYGLRISEVLAIGPGDVMSSGHIRIKGLKGSNDRIVLPREFSNFWLYSGRHLLPLSTIYSRFYFYRQFKRLGLYRHYAGYINNSVTHVFRNDLLQQLSRSDVDLNNLQHFVGHKSQSNTAHYANKRKI